MSSGGGCHGMNVHQASIRRMNQQSAARFIMRKAVTAVQTSDQIPQKPSPWRRLIGLVVGK
jgi:hypothetical protein